MRVLFDMVDTAHVHFFRPIIKRLKQQGHEVLVTARQKDVTLNLLQRYDIDYVTISKKGNGIIALAWELFTRNLRLINIVRKFKPDVMLAKNGGASVGPVGALMGVPRIVLEDTEHAKLQRMIGLPFATRIVTGTGYLHDHGLRQRRFNGVWVQSYLNKNQFKPDREKIAPYGIDPDEFYIIIRTVAWEAAHDVGHKATTKETLSAIVQSLTRFGKVLICSETPLPDELKQYANPVPPENIHHLMAFANFYMGEGASMAAEAAVLGVPPVYCNPLRLGYMEAMESDYGIIYSAKNMAQGLKIAEELLAQQDLAKNYKQKIEKFLNQSDDLVELMLDEIRQAAR